MKNNMNKLVKKSFYTEYIDEMGEKIDLYKITINQECFQSKENILQLMDYLKENHNDFYKSITFNNIQPTKEDDAYYYKIGRYLCTKQIPSSDVVLLRDVEIIKSKEYDSYGTLSTMYFEELEYYIIINGSKIKLNKFIFTPYGIFFKSEINIFYKEDFSEQSFEDTEDFFDDNLPL